MTRAEATAQLDAIEVKLAGPMKSKTPDGHEIEYDFDSLRRQKAALQRFLRGQSLTRGTWKTV